MVRSSGVLIVRVNMVLPLTFATLWANSADDKLIFFQKIGFDIFMQIISSGDNLQEMSKPLETHFWGKQEKYIKILSAEIFTQRAKS